MASSAAGLVEAGDLLIIKGTLNTKVKGEWLVL
jgi:hypothetical protein